MEKQDSGNSFSLTDAEYIRIRESEDSSYKYHGADAEKTDKENADDGYPEVVLAHVQMVTSYILRFEDYFRQVMTAQKRQASKEAIQIRKKELDRDERRISELKRLFIKVYEDNAAGRLSDERYEMLSQTYEAEQKQLEADTARLRQEIEVQEAENDHLERFIEKARAYVGIKKLDGYILHELISAIYVSAPDKSSGHREQHIRIEYNGIGFIPIHELMAKQTA